jgi:magnesium-protoporphyrin O-methyltransferase
VSDCCNPAGYGRFFDEKEARRNLRRYDEKGLDKMARRMVACLTDRGLEGRSVLEVGGGIGALQVELLEAGASRAVNIELSPGYEAVAAELLQRQGLQDRVKRRVGDFTDLAAGVEADDVVMNRVICCYPDMERLMGAALATAKRFVAASFPRDTLVARLAIAVANAYSRIRRIDFRAFIHSPEEILDTARRAGFEVVWSEKDLIWQGVVFEARS